jgi:aspartokinase/homoserine dehydrogenase 1
MKVLKFGGTSVGSADALNSLAAIVANEEHRGSVQVVVVSALSGMTDSLIALSRSEEIDAMQERHNRICESLFEGPALEETKSALGAICNELRECFNTYTSENGFSAEQLDEIMSFGERLSANLISRLLCSKGIDAEYVDSRRLIVSDSHFGAAHFLREQTYANIRQYIEGKNRLFVAPGFIASDDKGRTTTLGRGGSDLSAAIFGAALGAEAIEIWTDVDGILTADPKKVPGAFRIDAISYDEAMEMAHFGAKVLHPPTVKPAWERGIPIIIKNTFNPSCPGTIIEAEAPSPYPIRGLSSLSPVALLRLQGSGLMGVAGSSSRVFGALAAKRINVILISQSSSEYSICFAVSPKDGASAAAALEEEFAIEICGGFIEKPVVENDMSIIAVVGSRMRNVPGMSGRIFYALGNAGVSIAAIAQGSSEINISMLISRADESRALNAVHEAFFRNSLRVLNLFLIGVGRIGGTLLEQIAENRERLERDAGLRIVLAGAASSKRMAFAPTSGAPGLEPSSIKAALRSGTASPGLELKDFNLDAFIQQMQNSRLPFTCFCDCTSNEDVAGRYEAILQSGIPIATPNKKACSGSLSNYKALRAASTRASFLYETTAGAALPVIATLRNLVLTGDRIHRIEASLSGTLSYIFNNFDGSIPFSTLVRQARDAGYTEPDPRDDLGALDAARKALILARECGAELELSDVVVEAILPPACFQAPDVESFFVELQKLDGDFEKRCKDAASKGKVLRYAASIDFSSAKPKAVLAMHEEGEGSPLFSLAGADNIVVVHSDRYNDRPLVIKGPGAGGPVTAGGVFADILKLYR